MTNYPGEKIKMSVEEYRNLPESVYRSELIDGELIIYKGKDGMSPAPKDPHQRTFTPLFLTIGKAITEGDLRAAPTDLYIDGRNVVQPDIFWVHPQNTRCILAQDGYWYGAPDLVVEILSPSTAEIDRGRKFDLYEQNGVREYWLVDVVSNFIEVYTLMDNKLMRYGVFGLDKVFMSSVLHQEFSVRELFGK